MAICKVCGVKFTPARYNPHQKYHSPECASEAKAIKQRERFKEQLRQNPNLWKDRYYANRENTLAAGKRWASSERGKELRALARAKPERKAKRRIWLREYRARSDIRPTYLQNARFNNERRRAIKMGIPDNYSKEEFERDVQLNNGMCSYCGKIVGSEKLTMDHVKPLSKGGLHERSNIVLICRSCNSSKGDRNYLFVFNQSTGKVEKRFIEF